MKNGKLLSPAVLQIVGLLLLMGFVAYWLMTGQESALLVGASLTLIGAGSATGAIGAVRSEVQKAARGEEENPPPQ